MDEIIFEKDGVIIKKSNLEEDSFQGFRVEAPLKSNQLDMANSIIEVLVPELARTIQKKNQLEQTLQEIRPYADNLKELVEKMKKKNRKLWELYDEARLIARLDKKEEIEEEK